ncbi:MAG: type I-E CRISPR-associated protein Cas7/Cse4/CasC [Candidatus Riflebacteria bacterium]|nr:type I-E CRISPR-associated protein Cas7/Cse4/CasC [Candidatus Riflebacteria bacterium]
MTSRFLQIHVLTSYPGALLNRDDAGFAKRLPFGGVTRTRISSQCLKRHWRTFAGEWALRGIGVPESFRSRHTFDRLIREPLEKEGVPSDLAVAVTHGLMAIILGESKKAKAEKKGKGGDRKPTPETAEPADCATSQITVLGRPEVEFFLKLARDAISQEKDPKKVDKTLEAILKREKDNLKALKTAVGLDAALFGRMVTSDMLARGDAAVHVAHAFTVHAEEAETDYFSAMDDLQKEIDGQQLGAGHINTSELTSGLYYGYVVVDVPLLVSNLEGCDARDWQKADLTTARKVIDHLMHLIATVSPGAKLGSTAPYGYAQMILAERGNAQPRSLANAFLRPVKETPDLLENAMNDLASHLASFDAMYGKTFERSYAALRAPASWTETLVGRSLPLKSLAEWASGAA